MHSMSKVDHLDGWDEPAEPCPATFDRMASYLVAWPKDTDPMPLDGSAQAKEAQAWAGEREIVSPRKRSAIAKALHLDEPRPVLIWEQMQERLARV